MRVQKGRERTLTAVRSPFRQADEATIPVLFFAGRAGPAPAGRGSRRFLTLSDQLLLRRGTAGEGDAVDGDSWALDDALVSGRHARLQRTAEGLLLEDLGSKNGTFLGAQRVTGAVALPEGAPFFVGEHAFLWRLISPATLQALEEEGTDPLAPVPTTSPALALVNQKLRRWAAGGEEILLVGETGVGKEVCAQAVHRRSGRPGELVPLNCAALPAELVESELFGYRPGAHSTARVGKPGLVERADGGTLFLDEVGEMPPEVQAKLLRFLQDRQLVPLGGRALAIWTCGCWRPPTARSIPRCRGRCGRTCWAVWGRRRWCCRPCASGWRISGRWPATSSPGRRPGRWAWTAPRSGRCSPTAGP